MDHYFEITVAADDVKHPEPHPQLYLEAFERLGATPVTGAAFEDSSTGVAAARAAGTYLVTVPSQPGKQLDGDYITSTLADPALQSWAQQVRPLAKSANQG